MTRTERREFWQQHLGKQKESGLTAVAYCRQERLKAPQFYRWRHRLNEPVGQSEPKGADRVTRR